MSDTDIISPTMAKELDARVDAAGGDISAVRHEVEDELHAYEQDENVPEDSTRRRLQIALLLAEIEYLDSKASAAGQATSEKHEGLTDRVRGWFHHGN